MTLFEDKHRVKTRMVGGDKGVRRIGSGYGGQWGVVNLELEKERVTTRDNGRDETRGEVGKDTAMIANMPTMVAWEKCMEHFGG